MTRIWRGNLVIWVTLIIGLAVSVLPLPSWAILFRPEWAALILLYWIIALPDRVNLGVAWILGLLIDALSGTTLGEHALSCTLMAYFAIQVHRQLRVFPLWQQALYVIPLIAGYQCLLLLVQKVVGNASGHNPWFWVSTLTSALLWPWLFILLRDCRRRFSIE